MSNNAILNWTFNFFTSVKIVDNAIVSIKPDHEYDLRSALTSLKFLLQDSGISRIPPGCKLPHQHYYNPVIHDNLDNRLYVILEKKPLDGRYIEYYLRKSEYGYSVGYESSLGHAYSNKSSHEKNIFEIPPESHAYKMAIDYIATDPSINLEEAKATYQHQVKLLEELINNLRQKSGLLRSPLY